jgi:hypothetical protein
LVVPDRGHGNDFKLAGPAIGTNPGQRDSMKLVGSELVQSSSAAIPGFVMNAVPFKITRATRRYSGGLFA